jgi:hypothetical protein
MHKEKLTAFRVAIVGLVLMPLINIAPAAKIYQMHLLPTSLPVSIQTARISCFVFALLCWISIPFINRHIRAKETSKMSSSGLDPEKVLLLLDLSLLLAPALIVLILSFLGYPIIDVYLYSYSIFVVMALWLFWKWKIFWTNTISKLPNREPQNDSVKSYTVVLVIMSILALAFLSLKVILIVSPPEGYNEPLQWNLPWALINLFLLTSCIVTIILRLINSPSASDVTAFISVLLAFWVPFGTAAYIYWRFKIKPRELLPAQDNAD